MGADPDTQRQPRKREWPDMLTGSGYIGVWAWIALVAAWLVCGALAAVAAWFGQLQGSGGWMAAGAMGLSGAFLGGEFVMMVVGHPGLSIAGATAGAVGILDLQRHHPELDCRPRENSFSRLWSSVSLLWPVLLAGLVGTTFGLIADSVVLGTLIAVAAMVATYQGRHSTRIIRR